MRTVAVFSAVLVTFAPESMRATSATRSRWSTRVTSLRVMPPSSFLNESR